MPDENVEPEPAGTPPASTQEHVSLRAWLIGSGLALLGILIIILGGGTFDIVSLSSYWQGVAANAGVAVLLIGPLFVVERAISGQLSRVDARAEAASVDSREAREEVQRVAAATEATLSDLSREVRAGLERVRTRDSRLHERVLEEVTQESLVALYRRALELHGVDRLGIRAALGNAPIWIRARAFERQEEEDSEPVWLVELLAQRADGSGIGTASAIWSPGEPAPDPFIRLAEALQRAGAYPGDDQFDAARILSSLARALQRTIELRTAPTGDLQVRPVAEIVNDDWAVTEFGLDSLQFDLWVEANELLRKPAPAWDRLADDPRLKSEEQQQALRAAFEVAQAFHGGRRRDDFTKVFGTIFRPPR
jgi:hypothetical protein